MDKKVLLIGRNPNVLANLAEALMNEGLAVETTNLVDQASQDFDAAEFDLIAFGRGVDQATNALLKVNFTAQNENVLFVDGLAPITSLLVKQIQGALSENLIHEKILAGFSCQQADPLLIQVSVVVACQLKIDLYQLDALHNTQKKTLVSEFITAGNHTFSNKVQLETGSTIKFLVAEANSRDLMILPLQG